MWRSPMWRRWSRPARPWQDPIPPEVRAYVRERDEGCVFARLAIPHECFGQLELDHVRSSGGLGLRSPSTPDNLVVLCPAAHFAKTLDGRPWRPVLVEWIERAEVDRE
jgi:5-methylcytosine-specific restriction endonuclease McrA